MTHSRRFTPRVRTSPGERVELGRVEQHDSESKLARFLRDGGRCEDDGGLAEVEEAREVGARGERVRRGEDHAKGEEREAEDWNLEKVWGEDQCGVVFREFEDGGEVGG